MRITSNRVRLVNYNHQISTYNLTFNTFRAGTLTYYRFKLGNNDKLS